MTVSSSLEDLLGATVLTVSGRDCLGRDLLAAGILSGRWLTLEGDLLRGLALCREAPADPAAVDDALRKFRLERRLMSADDFKAWMAPRGLRLAQVREALARGIRRAQEQESPVERASASFDQSDVDREVVREALAAEAVCTTALQEIGYWLADRLLVPDSGDAPGSQESAAIPELVVREHHSLAGGAVDEPDAVRAARFTEFARLDAAYAAHAATLTTPPAVAARARERELDWVEFELDELRLPSPGGAAEVARAIADDGAAAADVAARAGVTDVRRRVRLEEMPVDVRPRLLAALPGAVVGPVTDEGDHVVWAVVERRHPDPADPDVAARCRADLAADAARRRRAGTITWHGRE